MAGKTKRRGAQERHDNPQPSEARSQPYAAAEFAAKAQNLEALRSAVVDPAGIGGSLWFSYLFALFYLLIAVGSVTHRELLLETPIKLPFLGIELPFVGFFVLGPLLFLIVHVYMLLHLVLLASRVGAFHTELHKQIADDAVRARLRRQLPSNVFVQFLAGPFEVRTGIIGFMLRLIAYISLIVGPLALLVFFQLQFLPYHHSWVTWWHRLIILADLVLMWMLWPSVVRGSTNWIAWQDLRRGQVAMAALASLTTLSLVFAIATYPGETLNERLPSIRWIPTYHAEEREQQRAEVIAAFLQSIRWKSLHEILVAGDVDYLANKPTSLWSNRLVLPGFDLIERAKPSDLDVARRETLSLRGRQLEGAVLIGARLRNVDFTGAQLRGANLFAADLRDANFGCVDGWDGQCADLREAKLGSAELQGASLIGANLQGADLDGSGLEGVSLYAAKLQGASLKWARLHGASLAEAHLLGATLAGAYLQGAILDSAQLHGTNLEGANLQGASLERTVLQGASLEIAKLQGASLVRTELQGATLLGARLRGASLDHAYLWRTDPIDMNDDIVVNESVQLMIVEPFTGASYEAGCPSFHCFWMDDKFAELKLMIQNQVPGGELRDQALRRIAVFDPSKSDQKADEARAGAWSIVTKRALPPDQYQLLLAKLLEDIGCDLQGAPHVIQRITRYLDVKSLSFRFTKESPHPARVASTFLDESRCSSARKLSEDDKDALKQIRDHASQPPPVKMPPETKPLKSRPGGLEKKRK